MNNNFNPQFNTFALLPSDMVTVLPRSIGELIFQPQVIFKPIQLRIKHSVAHKLIVRDVVVGNKCMFISTGDVSAEVFCELRRDKLLLPIKWDNMLVSQRSRVVLYNPTDKAINALAFFVGYSERY